MPPLASENTNSLGSWAIKNGHYKIFGPTEVQLPQRVFIGDQCIAPRIANFQLLSSISDFGEHPASIGRLVLPSTETDMYFPNGIQAISVLATTPDGISSPRIVQHALETVIGTIDNCEVHLGVDFLLAIMLEGLNNSQLLYNIDLNKLVLDIVFLIDTLDPIAPFIVERRTLRNPTSGANLAVVYSNSQDKGDYISAPKKPKNKIRKPRKQLAPGDFEGSNIGSNCYHNGIDLLHGTGFMLDPKGDGRLLESLTFFDSSEDILGPLMQKLASHNGGRLHHMALYPA